MRVVSLLASGTEIICALGAGDNLAGRSHECDNPSWVRRLPACTQPAFDINVTSGAIDAEVRRRLKAGEPLYHVDTELLRELQPDLLITQDHCQVCAVTAGDVERAGCGVVGQVLALSAGTLAGIYDGVRNVAAALRLESAGQKLIDQMRQRMRQVTQAVQHRRAPSIVMLEWTDPIFVMGNWGPELVEAANGHLLLGEKGAYSSAIPWEQVRAADPEYLIVAPCGFDLNRTLREIPTLEALPGWSELRAVREGHVAYADGNRYFNRSGTTVVQTVEILAEILHGVTLEQTHRGQAWQYASVLREK
jgi:iron complex transport system substrate-binding protein